MRKIDESRAANYIRKHSNYKKWLAFVLCLSLLTGTVTLYILNKPATAMTEEGAEGLGVVLETASDADEKELIQQTIENKSGSDGEDDDDLFSEFDEDDDDNDDKDDNDDVDEPDKSGDGEETKEDLVEEEVKEGETKEGEEEKEKTEEETELTEDVVLTLSYVDEDGEAIADEKEIDIYDSIDLTSEAPSIEGYTFKEATFKGDVITKIAVKKNADDIRYYEVTFDGDETKEINKDATVVLTYTADEKKEIVLTASYVDEDGKEIADEKELEISESFDPKMDADPIEGYTFKKAKIDENVLVLIKAIVDEESGEKYYEATLKDDSTVEIKQDTKVELTYAVVDTAVVLTANYVDKNGEEIQDSKDLNIGDKTELKKSQITEVDGYFFYKAIYEEKEITNITPIFEEDEKDTDLDDVDTEEIESENASVKAVGYEFTTVDGEEIKITEDAEIEFTYLKASTETEFIFSDSKVTVTAIITDKNVFPEGIELKVSELTSESTEYNYAAYLQAINDNASNIAAETGAEEAETYDEKNTLMYDIAFMLENVEYQPAEGSVQISIKLNDKKLSEENNVASEEDVTVLHLPIDAQILENLDATSDATDITASDVKVEVLTESKIAFDKDSDNITFEETSFSVHAITWINNKYAWTGDTEFSTSDIIGRLGKSQYFGAVADVYVGTSSHSESSVAAKNFLIGSNQCLGNSLNVYQRIEACTATLTKTVNTIDNQNDRVFYFAVYSDADANNRLGDSFELTVKKKKDSAETKIDFAFAQSGSGIQVTAKQGNSTLFSETINGADLANLFIFELDSYNGNPVKNGETSQFNYFSRKPTFEVTYTSDEIQGGNSIINGLAESYAYNVYQGNGGSIEDEVASIENGTARYATEKEIYGVMTPLAGNKFYFMNPDLLGGYDYYSENYYGSDGTNHDPKLSLAGHSGDFPVNIDSLLNNAADLSVDLAAAMDSNSGKTEVYNIKATTGNICTDANNAFGNTKGIDIAKAEKSLQVGDGHIAIINLDLSNYKDSSSGYQIDHFFVNNKQTGDWSDIAEKLIINAVQWDKDSEEFKPYTGKLTVDTCSGTVIAPKAKVEVTGSFSGTVIGGKIRQACEIHKWELRLNKKITANIKVSNVDTSKKVYEIELTKLWETNKGTNSIDEQTVEFTLYKKSKNSESYVPVTDKAPTLTKNDLTNTWMYKWTELEEPADFDYYVAETKVPEGFTSSNPESKKLKVIFPEGEITGTITGTAEIKNSELMKVVVKKQWGFDGDPYAKDQSFDVSIQLLRKLSGEGDDKYVAVEEKKATIRKGEESVTFTDLPKTDANGTAYEYYVQESVGNKVFKLNGDSINGFKLKSIEPFEVENGVGIKLTNVPVMLIEKIFTVNGTELTKEQACERFPDTQIFVHLYKSFEANPTLITLNAGNNWQQEVEITRGNTGDNGDQQYSYYIVEYNAASKTDYPESVTIMYFRYIGDDVASSAVGSDLKVKGDEITSASLKLQVRNDLGGNVLPSTGGIGDLPYMAAGAGTALVGVLGTGLFYKKKKDEDQEEE